jgi:hypothetical protein
MHDLKRPIEVPELGPDVPRWEKGDEDLLFPMAVGKMTIRLTPEAYKKVRYHEDDRSMGNSTITIPGLFPHVNLSASGVRDSNKKSLTLTCYEHATKGVCFYGATLMEFWQILREHIVSVQFEFQLQVLPGMGVFQGNWSFEIEKKVHLLLGCWLQGDIVRLHARVIGDLQQLSGHPGLQENFLFHVWREAMYNKMNLDPDDALDRKRGSRRIGVVAGFQPHNHHSHFIYDPTRS